MTERKQSREHRASPARVDNGVVNARRGQVHLRFPLPKQYVAVAAPHGVAAQVAFETKS